MRGTRWAHQVWSVLDAPGTRLLERAAGEREIALNRLVAGCVTFLYQAVLALRGLWDSAFLAINTGYILAGVALLLHIRRYPQRSPARRYLSLALEIGGLSAAQALFSPYTLVLFPFFVWVILGYGFRFGISYLRSAAVLSLVGFAAAVAVNPYLRSQPFLVAGLGGGLIAIPPYLEAMLRRTLAATETAARSNDARAFVLASLSHTMRTPLGAMAGLADQLDGTALDPDQRSVLAALRQQSRSILSEMDTLLEIARAEAGHTPVATGEVGLLALLRETAALAGVEARAKGLQLSLHVTPGTPLHIQTDRRHLGQVVQVLVENAVRFTAVGSVLLSADGSRCTRNGSPLLRLEIIDTGIGVPRHEQTEIFAAYARANEAVLSRHAGAGLGLSIARHLVQLLGGRIGLESRAGTGSMFWVELPVLPVRRDRRPDLAGVGVVLLSQEPVRLGDVAARLERLGARAVTVDRADRIAQAVADSADGCDRVSLVLDGRGVDPVEMALAIRRQSLFGKVPLVLLAAAPALPPVAVRRHYATTIGPSATDEELCAALQIVGPHEDERRSEPSMEADLATPELPQARSLKVLVADDSRTSLVTMAQLLTRAGHTVRAVGGGDAILDALEREEFDLAIVDLQDPGNAEAAKLYRVIEMGKPRLPIIGLAADAEPAGKQHAAAADLDAYLAKPVDHERLLTIVAEVAPRPRPAAQAPAQPAPTPPGVAAIASHPRFTPGLGPPPTDEFNHLAVIGTDGLGEVAEAFEADAKTALAYLATALARQDLPTFRGQLGALRDTAIAIDASRLVALCDAGKVLPGDKIWTEGRPLLDRLTREVDRVRQVLGKRQLGTRA